MTAFLKIIGNFRWLAFLSGAVVVGLVSWMCWPDGRTAAAETMPQTVRAVRDSSGVQSLQDSMAALRARTQTVRLIRVIVRDTVKGTETIYLDSGAVTTDTVRLVRIVKDTGAVTVHNTLYEKMATGNESADNVFSGTVYYDESGKPGVRCEYSRRVIGPLSGLVYTDYQDRLESGLGVTARWKIFNARVVVRNYGYKSMDFGYEVSGGVSVRF